MLARDEPEYIINMNLFNWDWSHPEVILELSEIIEDNLNNNNKVEKNYFIMPFEIKIANARSKPLTYLFWKPLPAK